MDSVDNFTFESRYVEVFPSEELDRGGEKEEEQILQRQPRDNAAITRVTVVILHLDHVVRHDNHTGDSKDERDKE